MLIADELLLLGLDDPSGRTLVGKDRLEPALGGALLVELALRERIGVTPPDAGWRQRGRVTLVNLDPTDDPELDALLRHLAAHERIKLKDLVSGMSGKRITKHILDRFAARLVASGVVREERSAVLGLRHWPLVDPRPEHEIRGRLHAALVDRTTPAERTVALISLLVVSGLLTKAVAPGPEGKNGLKRRAKELSEGDWAAKAVKQAIDEVAAATVAIVSVSGGGDGGGGS